MEKNSAVVTGVIVEIRPLRRSPAGIEQLAFRLRHCSRQVECGKDVLVDFEVWVHLSGELASKQSSIVRLSGRYAVTGYLDVAGYQPEMKGKLVLRALDVSELQN